MGFHEFTASDAAVAQARSLGVGGDVKARLLKMAKRSAPFTSDFGNRRFDDWVLRVEDGEVTAISTL